MKKMLLLLTCFLLFITAAVFMLNSTGSRSDTELANEQPTEQTSASHSLITHEHHKDNPGTAIYSDIMEYMEKICEDPEISKLFLE